MNDDDEKKKRKNNWHRSIEALLFISNCKPQKDCQELISDMVIGGKSTEKH